ncbi:MAG: arylsulfotransferase family protein [Planctomycetota bacterium]|jgi:hypothetical protein|nr:arylsulfotransferase family protein [Planctomycetota bacterium]MDP6763474.1 arylsulfotransferase family protein [Planctomycetota bacterium]MDP6988842.1 arylsulfotransferase family protein [Planctomycetota bacterium]
MRGRGLAATLLCAGAVGFVWGFFTHRDHWFPHALLRNVADRVAARERPTDPFPMRSVRSPSPAFEDLTALGYVDSSFDPDSDRRGVFHAQAERSFEGLNLYSSRTARSAQLVDMEGRVRHRWASDTTDPWQAVTLLADGRLLVIEKDRGLLALDSASRPLWRFEARVHHDLDVSGERITVLTRRDELRPDIHPSRPVVVDELSILAADGTLVEVISLLDMLQRSPFAYLLPSLDPAADPGGDGPLDLLHTNHVQTLDGAAAALHEAFAPGNLLLCARNINAVFVLDPGAKRVLWLWGPGTLTFPHHPQVIESGHLLVFDNGLVASRVLEVDPLARRIVWSYAAEGFFSATRGSAQRLPNGNTLITESDSGYALEVDPRGETVWEFANPDVDSLGNRSAMWRVTRYAPGQLAFLDDSAPLDR